jgi:hypothetical protein
MREIPLVSGGVALVDDEDHAWLSQWSWSRGTNGYVVRTEYDHGANRCVYMHRLILGVTDRKILCDHRHGNTLDNRRSELRQCSPASNAANSAKWKTPTTSRFKGVSWMPARGKWRAAIGVAMKSVHLGLFTNESEAARAYNAAAQKHFGEFARLNLV